MSYVVNNTLEIIKQLSLHGLSTTNEGFGRNALANAPYTQYIIYLHPKHLHDTHADLADIIENACHQFVIDGFKPVVYRKGIGHNQELWCFCHLKEDDLNFVN